MRRRTAPLVGETMSCATKLTSYWMSGWSDAMKLHDPTADLKSVFRMVRELFMVRCMFLLTELRGCHGACARIESTSQSHALEVFGVRPALPGVVALAAKSFEVVDVMSVTVVRMTVARQSLNRAHSVSRQKKLRRHKLKGP